MEAGRCGRTFSFNASKEYGEGVAGIIESQMMDSELRSWEFGLSDEEYVA